MIGADGRCLRGSFGHIFSKILKGNKCVQILFHGCILYTTACVKGKRESELCLLFLAIHLYYFL